MSTQNVSIRVRFVGPLRAVAGSREVSMSLPTETSVIELAGPLLLQEFGQKAEVLVNPETGKLRGQFRVLLNGKYVDMGDGDQISLQDGDAVSLLPVVGGGTG